MFNKILIANRGEIACRVIETAHKLGIRCVAVYSEADANAMHVNMADEAFLIGPAPSKDSYLKYETIIDVAKKSGAQAIHPGYGFLSENPVFAKACADNGLVFIGPPVAAIEAMGSKSAAKLIMENANVPLVPGYHGDDQDESLLLAEANKVGYPLLLKAAYGGGGKGMRVVESENEFSDALASAKREALNGFGNDKMLIEKYLTKPRHVEIQVFCDDSGNGVYLAERDCSVQRRHQKVIEEAPAPGLPDSIRKAMGEAAVRAAQAINYQGAGTVEFLYDENSADPENSAFYFMEMNTRLQVEHPVTEMITGQDLVKWQLQIAAGEPLPLRQEDVTVEGHAFEVRIYAEDPDNDFLPATGTLNYLRQPEQNNHVRVDTGVRENDEVSAFYDPMIAKLIVWDENRERGLQRMLRALDDYRIAGVKTNLNFLSSLLEHKDFQQANLDTNFIAKNADDLFKASHDPSNQSLIIAALFLLLKQANKNQALAASSNDPFSPWHSFTGWRVNQQQQFDVTLNDENDTVHNLSVIQEGDAFNIGFNGGVALVSGELNNDELVANIDGHNVRVTVSHHGDELTVFNKQHTSRFTQQAERDFTLEEMESDGGLTAPMNGTIVAVLVNAGDEVKEGQALVIMEAMKMEYTISATADGKVSEVFFAEGDLVADGAELLSLEES